MSSSSDNVGSVALALTLDTSSFSTKLNSVAKKAASTLAAVFSVKAITSFTKQCIELGSDLQEVQNVVDVTFSTMSDKVDEFAQSAAASFGLSETMAKQYVGMYGSMAEAFGFAESEAYDMATTLTGLAGDVASFYNISQDEAYTKLKSVFSGETETLKDLGIVMTQSALDAYALANGFGKTTSAMTEAEKVSLRYAFIQDQLSNATGDFYRTQDSWANQSRLLALQAQSAMAAVGQGLINLLTPALKAINTVMASIVKLANAFNDLTEALFGSASSGTSAVSDDLTSASDSASSLADSLTDGTSAISSLGDSTSGAAKSLGTASKTAAALKRSLEGFDQITRVSDDSSSDSSGSSGSGSGDTGSGTGTGSAGVSTVDTSALESVTDAAEEAESSVSKLSSKMQALLAPAIAAWNNLKNSFTRFADKVKEAGTWILNNVLIPLGTWTISEAVPAVLNVLAAAFDVLTAALEALEPYALWIWENFLEPLANWTGDLIISFLTFLADKLEGVSNWIEEHPDTFANIVLGITTFVAAFTAAKSIVGVITTIVTAIGSIITTLQLLGTSLLANPITLLCAAIAAAIAIGVLLYKNWDTIKAKAKELGEKLKTIWNNIKTTISNAVTNIKTKVTDTFTRVKDKITSIFTSVKTWLSTTWTNIKTTFTNAVTSIKTKVTTAFDTIKTAITNPLTTAKNTVSNILTSIKDKFSTILNSAKTIVKNAIDKIKGFFNFTWSLPKLKMPHISIKGSFSLSPPSVPKFSIEWYKKAMDNPMLLNGATIFGAAGGNLLGGGEAGQEVVSGASTLMSMIQAAVQGGLSGAATDLSGLVERSTPRLAAVTSDAQAREEQRQADSLAQNAQDLEALEALLREILAFLQSADLVRLDPESLRKYFIKKTNNNTVANGGKCELVF
ncbi:MAG: hypothetical protein LIO78_08275 [Clostridiales bacterium]|nr:hypothetical protein [Clostridiales bacterium]MCC8100038.1 hypothetical protein [Clostridiales bacterium]